MDIGSEFKKSKFWYPFLFSLILAQPNQTADAAYSSELSLYIDLYLSGVIFIESAHYLYTDGSYFAYFQYG